MGWIIVVNEPGAAPEQFARTISRAEADTLAERIRAAARRHQRTGLKVTVIREGAVA